MMIDDAWWKFFDHHNINPASLNDVAWVKKNEFILYIYKINQSSSLEPHSAYRDNRLLPKANSITCNWTSVCKNLTTVQSPTKNKLLRPQYPNFLVI